jgi:hypothetical protein
MAALSEQEQQVVELFRQVDPTRRRALILELAQSDANGWKRSQIEGEARLRELARQAGHNWDEMDDGQRQDFIENLLDGDAR